MGRTPPRDFVPVGPFAIRVPLLPFDTLVRWAEGLGAAKASAPDVADAFAADAMLLESRLRTLVRDPIVREALFCASPSLDEAVDAWLSEPASPRARGVTSILVRYLSRMSGRATPFGLFSSCAIGRMERDGSTILPVGSTLRRRTRLDSDYLTALVAVLERQPDVRADLRFSPSTGLARIGDHIHYAESEVDPKKHGRTYKLVSIDASGPLDAALAAASGGAQAADIARAVLSGNAELQTEDPEDDASVALAFVHELIDSQVLVSDLQPPITGREPIDHVIDSLAGVQAGRAASDRLSSVRAALAAMDADGVGIDRGRYRALERSLRDLPVEPDPARLVQVDLAREANVSVLGGAVMCAIEDGIDVLRRIALPTWNPTLKQFRDAFAARYEAREVPLVEALDEELGVGFGSTSAPPSGLIEGLALQRGGEDASVEAHARDLYVLRRASAALAVGTAWELTDDDVDALEARSGRPIPIGATKPGPAPTPDVFAVSIQIAAASREALDRGAFAAHVAWSGALPQLLGRFCHGDAEVERATRDCLAREEALDPDVIMAEIVHLPAGRLANILARPVLRAYELPYLGSSGAPSDAQIQLDDLLVSVQGDRIRLRSKRLAKWVLPRQTTAHNPMSTALSPYRFLCALAYQSERFTFGWRWGVASALSQLPRVTRGNVVLALRQWNLDAADLEGVSKQRGAQPFQRIQDLRRRLGLPRWVAYREHSDHVLPLDLENPLSVATFVELLKDRRAATFQELFPAPEELVVEGPVGRYVAEIFVPFVATRSPSVAPAIPTLPTVARTFAPGSEWLYAKIYAGPTSADVLLREVIAPLVDEALAEGDADGWFFIRYADPDPHLRVRFHGDPARLARVHARLHAAMSERLAGGVAHRVVIDTYQREVERYGGDVGVLLSEALFAVESRVVLDAIQAFDGASDADVRWRLAIVGMDRILGGLGFDLAARCAVLARLRAGFGEEFGVRTHVEAELGARFRKVRADVDALVQGVPAERDPALAAGLVAIERLAVDGASAFAALIDAAKRGALTESLESLAGSYLHMHANRMLASDHRAQELVLYDYLHRHYESRVARARKASKP